MKVIAIVAIISLVVGLMTGYIARGCSSDVSRTDIKDAESRINDKFESLNKRLDKLEASHSKLHDEHAAMMNGIVANGNALAEVNSNLNVLVNIAKMPYKDFNSKK